MSLSLLLAAGSIAAVTYVGMRDHRAAKAARRGLLDGCAKALDRRRSFTTPPTVSRALPATITAAKFASIFSAIR